jgi:hypothetical protein
MDHTNCLQVAIKTLQFLVDKERVTLRLWLRAVKVKLDVAVDFWSQHVPEKDSRAPMAHVYAKKYACVGCPKIRAQGLCPFQDSDKSIVSWCTEVMPSATRDIEDIVACTQCPSKRCACFFALRHGAGLRTGPSNPALYFARAVEAGLQ